MTVDLQVIAGWIAQLGIISGVIIGAYKLLDKHLLKRISKLEKQMTDNEKWTEKQQIDINDGSERDKVIIEGVLACLYGLQEKGCNGAVTEAIKNIGEYVNGKAYKTVSQLSKTKGD